MKNRSVLFSIMMVFFVSTCNGQEKKEPTKNESTQKVDENFEPKGMWKVNKEFDENGNLIRYDSTYTWSSTGKYDDSGKMNLDSLMGSYRSFINNRFSLMPQDNLSDFFLNDSIFPRDFNSQDFFGKSLNSNFMMMDSIRKRMEKVRREMLKDFFPEEH